MSGRIISNLLGGYIENYYEPRRGSTAHASVGITDVSDLSQLFVDKTLAGLPSASQTTSNIVGIGGDLSSLFQPRGYAPGFSYAYYYFSGSATWTNGVFQTGGTVPYTVQYVNILVVGGGGGGGGGSNDGGNGNASGGGGGGGGGTWAGQFYVGGANQSVSVGTGGTHGVGETTYQDFYTAGNGGNGTASTFGSKTVAYGGGGSGGTYTNGSIASGGNGGASGANYAGLNGGRSQGNYYNYGNTNGGSSTGFSITTFQGSISAGGISGGAYGVDGGANRAVGGGGGGASSYGAGGYGGRGGNFTSAQVGGSFGGGGGGGGSDYGLTGYSCTSTSGADGGAGIVVVYY